MSLSSVNIHSLTCNNIHSLTGVNSIFVVICKYDLEKKPFSMMNKSENK